MSGMIELHSETSQLMGIRVDTIVAVEELPPVQERGEYSYSGEPHCNTLLTVIHGRVVSERCCRETAVEVLEKLKPYGWWIPGRP